MKFFVNDTGKEVNPEGPWLVEFQTTPSYIEVQIEKGAWVAYFVPLDEHSLLVAACCDDYFDFLDSADQYVLSDIAATWPKLVALVNNALRSKFSQAVLLKLNDLDTADPKWFVATVVGNLDFKKMQEVIDPRLEKATQLVLSKASEALEEVTTKELSKLSLYWKSIKRGLWEGAKLGAKKAIMQQLDNAAKSIVDSLTSPTVSPTEIQLPTKSGHPMTRDMRF
ncbi:MAG: hypothetical protein ICV60_20905 [Pyrinomonadaceae bacterium]|nr:hypothetical protein [Pyrinomonadaceae bacterium]